MPQVEPSPANEQELLELLDDLVYGAINGRPDSLAELTVLWPSLLNHLGPQRLDESREQYLRFALSIWSDYLADPECGAKRAAAALDVICLLFD